jgi:hypothetical protein
MAERCGDLRDCSTRTGAERAARLSTVVIVSIAQYSSSWVARAGVPRRSQASWGRAVATILSALGTGSGPAAASAIKAMAWLEISGGTLSQIGSCKIALLLYSTQKRLPISIDYQKPTCYHARSNKAASGFSASGLGYKPEWWNRLDTAVFKTAALAGIWVRLPVPAPFWCARSIQLDRTALSRRASCWFDSSRARPKV